jgi:hypothetical protein
MTEHREQGEDDGKWWRLQFFANLVRIALEAADLIDRFFFGGGSGSCF